MDVNAGNRAARESCDSKCRTASSASDIEESLAGSQAKPAYKLVLLVGSEPAILADVFSIAFSANFLIWTRLKIPVGGVVLGRGHLDFTMPVGSQSPRSPTLSRFVGSARLVAHGTQ